MVLSIIFLEDKHKILLHLSIFYEYQQFYSTPYLFLDTAATLTRKFTQKSQIFRHKTSHMVLSIIFLEDKHKMLLHLSIFYEYRQFFNTVSVSRYSRPITVTRDPDQHVPAVFFLILLFNYYQKIAHKGKIGNCFNNTCGFGNR